MTTTALELKIADRCDRCPAQAQVATTHGPRVLQWCKHHFERHEAALLTAGAAILADQRSSLFDENRLVGAAH